MTRILLFLLFSAPYLIFYRTFPDQTFLYEAVTAFLVLVIFVFLTARAKKVVFWSPVIFLWLVWGIALAASIATNHYPLKAIWNSYFYAWLITGLAIISFSQITARHGIESFSEIISLGLLVAGIIGAAFGFAQFYGLFPEGWDFIPGVSSRLVGIFGQPNTTGVFCLLAISSAAYLFNMQRIGWLGVTLFNVPLGMAVLATGSRTAWIGLAAIAIYEIIGWARQRQETSPSSIKYRRLPLVTAFLGVILMAPVDRLVFTALPDSVLPERPLVGDVASHRSSDVAGNARWTIWDNTYELVKENAVLGVGAGKFGAAYFRSFSDGAHDFQANSYLGNAHSLPLMVAAEFGLLGCMALLAAIIFLIVKYKPFSGLYGAEKTFAFSVIGIILIHSATEYPLWNLSFTVLLFAMSVFLFPLRKLTVASPRLVTLCGVSLGGVGLLMLANYVFLFWSMAAVVNGWGGKNADRDYATLSSMEYDGLFGHKARFLKYNFFDTNGLTSEFEIKRTREMLDLYPSSIVVSRYSIMAIVNDLDGGCEWTSRAIRYYPATRGYLQRFYNAYRGGAFSKQFHACLGRVSFEKDGNHHHGSTDKPPERIL